MERVTIGSNVHAFAVRGIVNLQPMISHVIPFGEAGEAFRILDQEPENALQVVLDFTAIGKEANG